MDFTIYSIGDSAFLTEILNSVAIIVGTGDFTAIVRIGFMVGVLIVAFGAIASAQAIPFQHAILAWIIFSIIFGTGATVKIENVYNGEVTTVANVPVGVAAVGSVISVVGYGLTDLMETSFSTPSMTGNGYAGALQLLQSVRKNTATITGLGKANAPTGDTDVWMSWHNYIKDCTLIGIDLDPNGDAKVAKILSNKDPVAALKFDSTIYSTQIFINGKMDLSCSDAYTWLQPYTTSDFYNALSDMAIEGIAGPGAGSTGVQDALTALGQASVNAQSFMLSHVLKPIYEEAAQSKHIDSGQYSAAVMVNQAIAQQNTQWAAEATLFARTVRPLMTFMEGFIYAITPIMGFVVALGLMGIKMVGKYLMLLLWVQLWTPVMAIINLYIHMAAEGKLSYLDDTRGINIPSLGSVDMLQRSIEDALAVGGALAASTPALSLMLIYGSAQTATHLAGRLKGGDTLDEKMVTPDLAKVGAVSNTAAMNQNSQYGGMVSGEADQFLGNLNTAANMGTMVSSAQGRMETATRAFDQQIGQAQSEMFSKMNSAGEVQQLGASLASSGSAVSDVVNSHAGKLLQSFSHDEGKQNQIRALVAGMATGNLSLSKDGKVFDKEGNDKTNLFGVVGDVLQGDLLGAAKGITGAGGEGKGKDSGARISGGGELAVQGRAEKGTTTSSGDSSRQAFDELRQLGSSDGFRADLTRAMKNDVANDKRAGWEERVSGESFKRLSASRQDAQQASNNYQEAASLQSGFGTQTQTLTSLAANQIAQKGLTNDLLAPILQNGDLRAAYDQNLKTVSQLMPNQEQARAAAALKTLMDSGNSDHMRQALRTAGDAMGISYTPGTSLDPNTNSNVAKDVQAGAAHTAVDKGLSTGVKNEVNDRVSQPLTAPNAPNSGAVTDFHQTQTDELAARQGDEGNRFRAAATDEARQRIMGADPELTTPERLSGLWKNEMSRVGDAIATPLQAGVRTAEEAREFVAKRMEEGALADHATEGGGLHKALSAGDAAWDTARDIYSNGLQGKELGAAFRDGYLNNYDQSLKEAGVGRFTEDAATAMRLALAAAPGNAIENAKDILAENEQALWQGAYGEAKGMGLTDTQSEIYAENYTRGLWDRVTPGDAPNDRLDELKGKLADELGNDPELAEKQADIISNASYAGNYSSQNLNLIQDYNARAGFKP